MNALFFRTVFQFGPPDGWSSIQPYLWILLVMLGALIVMMSYRLLFPNLQKVKVEDDMETKVEKKKSFTDDAIKEEGSTLPIKQERSIAAQDQSWIEMALHLMNGDERRIIEALLEAEGAMLQKDLSWKTGFSRVKTHRVLAKLIRRGIVSAEKYYNTNKIILSDIFLSKKKKV